MLELKEYKGRKVVSAKDIYNMLEVKRQFSKWIADSIKNSWLSDNKDYYTRKTIRSDGKAGKGFTDYLLTERSALSVIVMSRVKKAQYVRNKILELFEKHQKGEAFTIKQIYTIIEISKSMTLISIQKDVERKHFNLYNNKYDWYQCRADLLGYSKETLIEAMRKVNRKHKSIRVSLIKLDANELIRTGVIDLFKALGKTDEYAQNVGNLAKKFASEMKLGNQIWDDTKENPLQLNQKSISDKKELFNNELKKLT